MYHPDLSIHIMELNSVAWALIVLVSGSSFTLFWFLDSLMHAGLDDTPITERELVTHRILIGTSLFMEASLVAMFWFPLLALPFFIATFLTRLAHEFIDELHFHMNRCTPRETFLHVVMWLSIQIKTFAMLIWGFKYQFRGVEDLHPVLYVWAGITFLFMAYTSYKEWFQKVERDLSI